MTHNPERRMAIFLTGLIHVLIFFGMLIVTLNDVEKTEDRLYIVLTEPAPSSSTKPSSISTYPVQQRIDVTPVIPSQRQTVDNKAIALLPEPQLQKELLPETVFHDSVLHWSPPRSVLDRDMSPEQALKELTRLLEEHPEYKEMVLRELFAGTGFARDSLPSLSLMLDDVLKHEAFLPSWMYEAKRVQESYGGYNPVWGYRKSEQYTGPQVNVFQLLKQLIELVKKE